MTTAIAQQHYIRWMIRRDMDEIVDIENQSFDIPWSEENFIECLRRRNCIGMVATDEPQQKNEFGKIRGFFIYELHKTKLHILNFAVSKEFRRQGVGNLMLAKLIRKLSPERRNRITLEVRETNLSAQLFFKEQGFRALKVERNFYEDTLEDAYLMQYRIKSVS